MKLLNRTAASLALIVSFACASQAGEIQAPGIAASSPVTETMVSTQSATATSAAVGAIIDVLGLILPLI